MQERKKMFHRVSRRKQQNNGNGDVVICVRFVLRNAFEPFDEPRHFDRASANR